MKRTLAFVLWTMLAFAQANTPARLAVIEVGEFHGSDVALQQPTSWLAVYCRDGACAASPETIQSKRVSDPLDIDEGGAPTGTSIQTASHRTPLFLVRGVPSKPRAIPTSFVGEQFLAAGDERALQLGSIRYTLKVEGRKSTEEMLPPGSKLLLSDGKLSQALYIVPEERDEAHITLLWAGDLDGDGRLDLYVDTSFHYNIAHRVLWLSSLAKSGQLAGEAAYFETTGC